MRAARPLLALAFVLPLGCSGDDGPADAGAAPDAGAAADAGVVADAGVEIDAGPQRPETLETLQGYLLGDFDNEAQFDQGFPQYVERHVCPLPGFQDDPEVLWLYVEHIEHVARGRDSYFIRLNEIRMDGEVAVSKAYRFPDGHPLRTNAFAFNGSRDACFDASLFGDVMLDALEYREGCDVTYTPGTDEFSAVSPEETCTFPGGWIQTVSTVFPDGLDSRDRAVTPGGESGSTFEFRRVENFTPPD